MGRSCHFLRYLFYLKAKNSSNFLGITFKIFICIYLLPGIVSISAIITSTSSWISWLSATVIV